MIPFKFLQCFACFFFCVLIVRCCALAKFSGFPARSLAGIRASLARSLVSKFLPLRVVKCAWRSWRTLSQESGDSKRLLLVSFQTRTHPHFHDGLRASNGSLHRCAHVLTVIGARSRLQCLTQDSSTHHRIKETFLLSLNLWTKSLGNKRCTA